MASIRKFKEWVNPFLRRISPFLFKELLLFMKIYHFFYRGNKKKELVSLRTQMRVGIKHLYNVYSNPKRTIWTTMFVPSEILFAMGLYPFCLEIGAALFAGLGQSSKGLKRLNLMAFQQTSVLSTDQQLGMRSGTYFPPIYFR